MDILPSDLATYGEDAKRLLNKLQTRNERLFMLTFLVLNVADTKQKLGNDVFQAAGVAQKYNCSLVRLDYQQEQGLVSVSYTHLDVYKRQHLYRVFMLNVGKSPIDYLTEYRINEACKLLRAGHLSIAEVAVSVGFFDQFYFSRVFKLSLIHIYQQLQAV